MPRNQRGRAPLEEAVVDKLLPRLFEAERIEAASRALAEGLAHRLGTLGTGQARDPGKEIVIGPPSVEGQDHRLRAEK